MYQPSIKQIKNHYTRLNKKIFRGVLPKSKDIDFVLESHIDNWGHCEVVDRRLKISLNKKFPDRLMFLNILVHEMVHVGEYIEHGRMSHGETFYKFRPLVEKFGYQLEKKY
jgi:hypothetical protein